MRKQEIIALGVWNTSQAKKSLTSTLRVLLKKWDSLDRDAR